MPSCAELSRAEPSHRNVPGDTRAICRSQRAQGLDLNQPSLNPLLNHPLLSKEAHGTVCPQSAQETIPVQRESLEGLLISSLTFIPDLLLLDSIPALLSKPPEPPLSSLTSCHQMFLGNCKALVPLFPPLQWLFPDRRPLGTPHLLLFSTPKTPQTKSCSANETKSQSKLEEFILGVCLCAGKPGDIRLRAVPIPTHAKGAPAPGEPRVSPHFSQNMSITTWDVTAKPCFLGNPLSLISAISIMNGSAPA